MKKNLLFLIFTGLLLIFSQSDVFAQADKSQKVEAKKDAAGESTTQPESPEASPAKEVIQEQAKPIVQEKAKGDTSKDLRSESSFSALANFSYLDTWLPGKIGVTFGYHTSHKNVWELEYMRAKITYKVFDVDLGELSEQRISLLRRSFNERNSFNFLYGLNYNMLKVSFGDDLLQDVTGIDETHVDLMEIHTLGVTWGVGNRWQFSNHISFGVDWFAIHIPVVTVKEDADIIKYTTDQSDRDAIEDAMDVITKAPALTVLRLQLGAMF